MRPPSHASVRIARHGGLRPWWRSTRTWPEVDEAGADVCIHFEPGEPRALRSKLGPCKRRKRDWASGWPGRHRRELSFDASILLQEAGNLR